MVFSDLFGVPADDEPPEEQAWSRPAWFGPPENELPACVPFGLVVARSDLGVLGISHAVAYSTGVGFELVAEARGLSDRDAQRLFHEQHLPPDGEDVSPGFLRVGLELANGARVSNLAGRRAWRDPETEPPGPVLMQHSGGGGTSGNGRISMRPGFWLWPVPAPGTLRLSCEWPLVGIPLSTMELDAGRLREASERAVTLWAE